MSDTEAKSNATEALVIEALMEAHKRTCALIAELPLLCRKTRASLVEELIGITAGLEEIAERSRDPKS